MSEQPRPIDRLRAGIRAELARLASQREVNLRDVVQFSLFPMLGELAELVAEIEAAEMGAITPELVARVIGVLAELLALARPALSENDADEWAEVVKEVAGDLVALVDADELRALLPGSTVDAAAPPPDGAPPAAPAVERPEVK